MRIVYDERKRIANITKHGFDFADFDGFEWAGAVVIPAKSTPGRSPRYKAIGILESVVVLAIVSPLGLEAMSLISLRRASRKERGLFQ